jgi:hypothetical protein
MLVLNGRSVELGWRRGSTTVRGGLRVQGKGEMLATRAPFKG